MALPFALMTGIRLAPAGASNVSGKPVTTGSLFKSLSK